MHARVRYVFPLLALLVLVAPLPAPRPARAAEPGVLRWTEALDVATLNPFLANSGNVADISELTMANLFGKDPEGRPVPFIATQLPTKANGDISRDGKTIVYHLRRGVTWSDGRPFDADDLLFTVAVVRNPANNVIIAGTEYWQDIVDVRKRDAFTIVVRLRRANIEFASFWLISGTQQCILPKHAFRGTEINTAPYNALPIGIGPFRYTAWRRGDQIEMEANPHWYGPRPKLRKMLYKLVTDYNTAITQLQTGELDLLIGFNGTDIARVRAIAGKRVEPNLTNYMSGVFLNTTRPPTDDVVVRRAVRLATDRRGLFERIAHGSGLLTESLLSKSLPDAPTLPVVPFDPEAAGRLLDADGWKLRSDGIRMRNGMRLTIDVAYPSGYAPSTLSVEELRASWKRAGIELQSHVYATGMFFAPFGDGGIVTSGKFGAALLSQSVASYSGLLASIGCGAVAPRGSNAPRLCDPTLDATIARYLQTDAVAERRRLATTIAKRLFDDVPIVVTYERSLMRAYDERLRGYRSGAYVEFYEPWNLEI